MSALLLALLLAAHPQDVQEEQAHVADKLETERLALEALKSSKSEVLRVVDELERMMRGSEARVDVLRNQRRGFRCESSAPASKQRTRMQRWNSVSSYWLRDC